MNTPTQTETLMGGITYVATKTDGTSETVTIRQLPIKLFPELLSHLENESAMAELFCARSQGWADTLTPDSFEHIVTEGERLNNDFFLRWVQRRVARQERLLPGITDKVLSSLNGSPKSPSKPA